MRPQRLSGFTLVGSSAKEAHRRAFTMIEILVVIVLIAILVALLLPAIGAAVRSSKNAAVTAEVNSLLQALADFRSKNGNYPPSRLLISERGAYTIDATTQTYATGVVDITDGQLAQRSVTWLRRIWPRAAFNTGTTASPPVAPTIPGIGFYDINGNGIVDPPYVLTGDECLVLFLGGIPTQVTTPGGVAGYGLSGFNRDPSNPFVADSVTIGGKLLSFPNRSPSLYEFRADRLVDTDSDKFPSYYDSLGTKMPFAFFSAYGTNAFDPCDVDVAESDDAGNGPLSLKFNLTFPVAGGGRIGQSAAPNPFTVTSTMAPSVTYHAPNSAQIISAGIDGLFGVGGAYSPGSDRALPPDLANTYAGSTLETDPNIRNRDADDLTSFATGKLD
jgi:prepilin-type N-terminal cleavage/methylation domain-containing protein